MIPVTIPTDPRGFRLGEIVVVIRPPRRACPVELAERVAEAGYDRLEDLRDWQHFRPRTAWWTRGGPARHARLRRRDLLLQLEDDSAGGQRLHAVGLLTAAVEQMLSALGPAYMPGARA
jgi:hypothetical protein